eukprot:7125026-Prymnesium_polylepis.2
MSPQRGAAWSNGARGCPMMVGDRRYAWRSPDCKRCAQRAWFTAAEGTEDTNRTPEATDTDRS